MYTKKLSTSQAIAHRLEQMVADGDFIPGQKMPSERQLAERLGVSRSMVREGIKELQGKGIVETRHGQGSFIVGIVPEIEQQDPLMQLFNQHARTLYDLLEVREQLEGQAAGLAAERGKQKDMYQITKAFEALEAGDPLYDAGLDYRFHRAIYEASHNPVLIHVLNSLKGLTLKSVETSVHNLSQREEFRRQIDKHHRQIYKAVINRQPARAQKAAMAHVRHVSESLRLLEQEGLMPRKTH